jgi:hypothetical protein
MSFELSFQTGFDESFGLSSEASDERSNALSFETSDARRDVTSMAVSDGRSDELSFQVSVLRCFPANSEAGFLTSLQGSSWRGNDGCLEHSSDQFAVPGGGRQSADRNQCNLGLMRNSIHVTLNEVKGLLTLVESSSRRLFATLRMTRGGSFYSPNLRMARFGFGRRVA